MWAAREAEVCAAIGNLLLCRVCSIESPAPERPVLQKPTGGSFAGSLVGQMRSE